MSLVMDRGPTNDKCQAQDLMAKAQTVAMPDTLCNMELHYSAGVQAP
jgi:hypothetical protein